MLSAGADCQGVWRYCAHSIRRLAGGMICRRRDTWFDFKNLHDCGKSAPESAHSAIGNDAVVRPENLRELPLLNQAARAGSCESPLRMLLGRMRTTPFAPMAIAVASAEKWV